MPFPSIQPYLTMAAMISLLFAALLLLTQLHNLNAVTPEPHHVRDVCASCTYPWREDIGIYLQDVVYVVHMSGGQEHGGLRLWDADNCDTEWHNSIDPKSRLYNVSLVISPTMIREKYMTCPLALVFTSLNVTKDTDNENHHHHRDAEKWSSLLFGLEVNRRKKENETFTHKDSNRRTR
jgi:hypothetical protein